MMKDTNNRIDTNFDSKISEDDSDDYVIHLKWRRDENLSRESVTEIISSCESDDVTRQVFQ